MKLFKNQSIMSLDPAKMLRRPIRIRSAIVAVALAAYLEFIFIIFFQAVVPSYINGTTSDAFSVDSTVYVFFANVLREGRFDPWVVASMAHFPNTLWVPVFLSLVLNSAFLIMLANIAAAVLSVYLLKRGRAVSLTVFLPLLLMNPTTTTSLLCVNKEIFDLLSLSMIIYGRAKRIHWIIVMALGIALLNRWETCLVIIMFLFVESRLNPWKGRRWTFLIILVLILNFAMPFWGAQTLAGRFEEAESGNTIAVLDRLQMHYLYVIAVIPKIAENLFGQILNKEVWEVGSSWLVTNLFNNIASAVLLLIAFGKRLLTLQNDLVYFAAMGAVIMAQSLAVQPRYFYFIYVLICLQVALPGTACKRARAPISLLLGDAHA